MKQVFYVISVMLFIPWVAKSQTTNPPPGGGAGSLFKPDNSTFAKMSEILPPPPNASAIARYGGVNVDLNTGNVNKSIDLRPLTNKSLSVPISLFFKSNGLPVNQYPSRVGMGWAIHVGGQISRVIHGADDFNNVRYVPSFNMQPNETDQNTTDYCWHLKNDGGKDGEPDVFSFTAGGYSGKFIFDNSGNILQFPASNLKIAFHLAPSPGSTFTITTPDGVQYTYGGNQTALEQTKNGNSAVFAYYVTNVWNLTKIQHPNGYYITFNYATALVDPYIVSIEQSQYKNPPDAGTTLISPDGTDATNGMMPVIYDHQSFLSNYLAYLTSVTTSYGASVTFEYSTATYPEKLITAINYYNENNKRVNRYALNYNVIQTSSSPSQSLPFLSTIKEYDDQNGLLNSGHTFDYYNLTDIPTRVRSYSQDHWGYYNGKPNATLIPTPNDNELAYDFPYATANREPDPQYAINGMLSSITYPTGGKDNIEYEANIISDYQDLNANNSAQVYQTVTGTTHLAWTAEVASAPYTTGYQNKIMLTTMCTYIGTQGFDAAHDRGHVRIQNMSTGANVYDKYFVPNSGQNIEFSVPAAGTYQVLVSSNGVDIKTDATVTYNPSTAANWQYVQVPAGGVRVKRTTTSNNAVNNPIIKRYYYGTLSNLNYSSATVVTKPNYYTPWDLTIGYVSGACSVASQYTFHYLAMNYNSLNRMYLSDGKIQEYNSVIESIGGDNFENGAIEHKFNTVNDYPAQPIRGTLDMHAPLSNSYYASKGEIETNVYANKTAGLVKVSATVNNIIIDTRNFNDNWFLSVYQEGILPCYATSSTGSIIQPIPFNNSDYIVSKYYLTSAWKYLSAKTETKYDENGLNPVTQVTNYYYDDARNLMLNRTEVLNSKGELMRQQNKYPHDFSATGNVYEDMVNKNIIAAPVETRTSKNGQDLFVQTNNYSNSWYTDKHVVAIDNVAEQKTGYPVEARFKYYSYDTDGNPTELSKSNDVHQAVIWDYKGNYPVAKVMNAAVADIAYTSFEADGKGSWSFTGTPIADATAPTGKMVYTLNGSNDITRPGLNSSTVYTVSYWIKSTTALTIGGTLSGYPVGGRTIGNWKYFEHKVSGITTLTVTGAISIDELRLYPDKTQMSTETFDPMTGMTSQCDVNNKITYYEYDGFNRMSIVRDQDKNILKKICYNYTGQPETCSATCTNFATNWQNTTTPLRCQLDQYGQNTGYQEQEQMDMNPCSPTFNQTQWVVAGQNTTTCPVPTNINLTSTNNAGFGGFTASYYNNTTGVTYNFFVSMASGLQSLGAVPPGTYTLTISKPLGVSYLAIFRSGCKQAAISGTSAIFYNVVVSSGIYCKSITIDAQ